MSTLLADAEARRAQGWEFALTATYVEIYNEKIRDLLNPDPKKNNDLKVSALMGDALLCRPSLFLGRVAARRGV